MLEAVFRGSNRYFAWLGLCVAAMALGSVFYVKQHENGLGITGLGHDVLWGLYIGQLTFWVGIAASAVVTVIPFYCHDVKAFRKTLVIGEILAIPACVMCVLFALVDLGRPERVMNLFLHPSLQSLLFWDVVAIVGYLAINATLVAVTVASERKEENPPRWFRPLVLMSIPWAVGIHTVTAFLYSGLAARPLWHSAIMAPRFLATAFASGPSCLVLVLVALKAFGRYDVGREPILKLVRIVTYCVLINLFFVLAECFTALYDGVPEHAVPLRYLCGGFPQSLSLGLGMWASIAMMLVALGLLSARSTRNHPAVIPWACLLVVLSVWIDKGMGLVVAGFVPNPFGEIPEYAPTGAEIAITLGIGGLGLLILTLLCKVLLRVRQNESSEATL